MQLHFHNSLTGQREAFVPQDPDRVTMYVCGPTVYDYVHIGNARPAVIFGMLAELLRRHFSRLVYARNITDVDDKINAASAAAGESIATLSQRFTAAYREDMAALGVRPPDLEPLATEHIDGIIALITKLIDRDHAYVAESHALFSVASQPDYGKLSRRDPDDMLAGARVDVAPYKKDPGDFVLWKPSTPDLPGWESPWGRGRPGWHIECSAMAAEHLGETIDIHAGGSDLKFPHHENEIAQSEAAHGKTFARYWLHNGMLNLGGRKMSKSIGNVFRAHDLIATHPPEALRLALLSAHYRQPLDWSDGLIEQSIRTLDRLYGVLRDGDAATRTDSGQSAQVIPAAIEEALADDLNTPKALAELAALAQRARAAEGQVQAPALAALRAGAAALGLLQQAPADWFARGADGDATLTGEVEALLARRAAAKATRDFATADAIRDEIEALGVVIEDTPTGPRWSPRR